METDKRDIYFKTIFERKNFTKTIKLEELKYWCNKFNECGLAPCYNNLSFGNLSFRTEDDSFIITASGLGMKDRLDNSCFVKVNRCDLETQTIYVDGARSPSSESMLHSSIYTKRKDLNAIFHGHSKKILESASRLNLVETEKEYPCGSMELVDSVLEVIEDNYFIIMKNHGFLSLGENMNLAGNLAVRMLNRTKRNRKIILKNKPF